MEVDLRPGDCVRWGPSTPEKGHTHPIFGPCLLWANGWMDQDATWYGDKPRPRRGCVRWGRSSPLKGGAATPVFGSCLLWPNGWTDEDATWYGSRPRPTPHCIRGLDWNPAPRERGTVAPFSAHVYCGHGRSSQLLLSSCYGRPMYNRAGHYILVDVTDTTVVPAYGHDRRVYSTDPL